MNDTPDRDVQVFTEALRLPPAERPAYLDWACAGDAELRHRVEALLSAFEKAAEGDFLGEPAPGVPQGQGEQIAIGEKPGERIGRYNLLQQIGEGGCGVVFMAEQEEPVRRRVALKVVKPGMDTKSVIARFEAERQVLALMDHPSIAHVFDAGSTPGGRPYFVMELVRGIKITEYCDQRNLTTAERLDLFMQVCQAVQHAHQKGIIHRDIKPSNVLVTTSDGGKPLPKVIDFGIAKATTGQRMTDKTVFTAFEMLIGTPAYMSPEQAELTGTDVDTRSDIYSLGVLLYELLTGTTPFDSHELLKAGLDEIRRVIREQEPVRPSTRLSTMIRADLTGVSQHRQAEPPRLIREVRGDLDWIVMTALEKDRGRRYQTANSLAEDIHRYLGNETVLARPPSRLYRFRKLIARHKLWFAAFGIVLATLVAGLSATTWSLAKEKRAHRDAEFARGEANKERKKAEIGEQDAKQVAEFLRQMLASVDPRVAQGRDTSILREILDKTEKRMDRELTNQPAVRADLQMTIGEVYGALGQYDKTEPLLRDALAFYRKSPTDAEPRIAHAISILSALHVRQDKAEEAEQEAREVLALQTKLHGKTSLKVVTAETQLGWVLVKRKRYAEAEELFRHALATGEGLVGDQSEQLLDTGNGLGTALNWQQKFAEGEPFLRKAVDIGQSKLGAEHPSVASAIYNLAFALEWQRKFDEAEALDRQCADIRRKMLGTDHPLFDDTLTALGRVLYNAGKKADAAVVLREVLSVRRRRLGDKDSSVTDLVTAVAEILASNRDEVQLRQLASEFPMASRQHAELLGRLGRWSEAMAAGSTLLEMDPEDHHGYYIIAPLLVQAGDRAAYEELCAKITSRFAGVTDFIAAYRMAQDCLILPRPGADLKVPGELAARAVAGGQKHRALHFFHCGMALAEYRQGHWAGAIDSARKAAQNPEPSTLAEAYAILAMAHFQLKQTDDSRAALKKSVEVVQTQLPKLEDGDLGWNWRDWIVAHALLTEAKGLIDGPAQPTGKAVEK